MSKAPLIVFLFGYSQKFADLFLMLRRMLVYMARYVALLSYSFFSLVHEISIAKFDRRVKWCVLNARI